MRLTYLDESGTSPRENIAVVCGVMIDADGHLILAEQALEKIAIDYGLPAPFIFHATDIWNGNSYFKDKRSEWPFERRFEILISLGSLLTELDIPVSVGTIVKDKITVPHGMSRHELQKVFHVSAFAQCAMGVEVVMRKALPDEITLFIAEDYEPVRKDIKEVLELLKCPQEVLRIGLDPNQFQFRHIKEGVMFARKTESKILQLADFCAFTVRSFLGDNTYRRDCTETLYSRLKPQLVMNLDDKANATLKNIVRVPD